MRSRGEAGDDWRCMAGFEEFATIPLPVDWASDLRSPLIIMMEF